MSAIYLALRGGGGGGGGGGTGRGSLKSRVGFSPLTVCM